MANQSGLGTGPFTGPGTAPGTGPGFSYILTKRNGTANEIFERPKPCLSGGHNYSV